MSNHKKARDETLKIAGFEFGTFRPEISFDIQVGNIIYLIGKKGTGKTTALLNILYHIRHLFWGGYAFVGTTTTAEQLSAHLPTKVIVEGFSKMKLDEIYAKISKLVKEYTKEGYDLRKHHFVVILDDVCWDKKIMNLPVMRKFHMNCRHIGVTLIVCAQYMMDLGPSLRNQIDYCIFGKNVVDKEIEKIRENYVPLFDKSRKNEFLKIFKALNVTGRMMVVDTATGNRSTDIQEVIKYFKTTKEVPSFTFGAHEFWAQAMRIPRSWLLKRHPELEKMSHRPPSSSRMVKESRDRRGGERDTKNENAEKGFMKPNSSLSNVKINNFDKFNLMSMTFGPMGLQPLT